MKFAILQLELMENDHPATDQQMKNKENLSQNDNKATSTVNQRVEISRYHFKYHSHMRINADNETSCRILGYVLIIILSIVVVSLISFLALPQATVVLKERTELQGTNIAECQYKLALNGQDVVCNMNNPIVAGQYVQNLVQLNQFLFFYLNVNTYGTKKTEINEDLVFRLYHTGRRQANGFINLYIKELITQKTININGETKDHYEGNRYFLSFMNKLTTSDQFYWEVRLKPQSVFISSIHFQLSSVVVNTNFTLFTIILRVVFFIISVIVLILFNRKIMKIPKTKVTVEQRFVQLLSAVTLTFNDQFYFISVIYPNPITSFISSFFIWNYVFLLFLMWGLFLSRILYEEHETTDTKLITKCKVFFIVLFYVLGLAYNVAYAISQTQDHPILTSGDLKSKAVISLKAFAFIALGLAILYIVYLNIQIFRRRSNRMYRSSIFMYISLLFFISTIIFFFIGGYNIFDYSAAKIMFYVTFMNFYSFIMQYLYSPTNDQINRFENWEDRPKRASQLIEIDNETIDIELENRSDTSSKSDKSRDLNNSLERKQGSIKRKRRIDRKKKAMNISNELKESSEKLSEHHHQLQSESVQDH